MSMELGYQIFQRLRAEAEERSANSPWGAVTARTPRRSIVHDNLCRCRDCKPALGAAMTPAYWQARHRRRIITRLIAFEAFLIGLLYYVVIHI